MSDSNVNFPPTPSPVRGVGASYVDAAVTQVKADIEGQVSEVATQQLLMAESIIGTTQTPTFVDEELSTITHKRTTDNVIIRTDQYTVQSDSAVEVRTLFTGESITITTNLTTFEMVVS